MTMSMKEPSGITNDAAHVDCYHEIDPQALVDPAGRVATGRLERDRQTGLGVT